MLHSSHLHLRLPQLVRSFTHFPTSLFFADVMWFDRITFLSVSSGAAVISRIRLNLMVFFLTGEKAFEVPVLMYMARHSALDFRMAISRKSNYAYFEPFTRIRGQQHWPGTYWTRDVKRRVIMPPTWSAVSNWAQPAEMKHRACISARRNAAQTRTLGDVARRLCMLMDVLYGRV